MTLIEQDPEPEKHRPPTAIELLGRLNDIPHIGSYSRPGSKDPVFIPPFVPSDEVDPKEAKQKGVKK